MKPIFIALFLLLLLFIQPLGAITKTTTIDVVDEWQTVAAGELNVGNSHDISGSYQTYIAIRYTGEPDQSLAAGALQFLVEISYAEDNWTLHHNYPAVGLDTEDTTINGTEAAEQTVLSLVDASSDGFDTVGLKWFILDGTIANSEVVRTKSAAGNNVTIAHDTLNEHTNSVVINELHEIMVAIPMPAAWVRVLPLNEDVSCDAYYTVLIYKVSAI